MIKIFFSLLCFALSFSVFAQNEFVAKEIPFTVIPHENVVPTKSDLDKSYSQITSVKLKLLSIEELPKTLLKSENASSLGEISIILDGLIAIGKKIWPIIEAGKPSVNANFNPMSVLPSQVKDDPSTFDKMYGWSSPKAAHYEIRYQNYYNMDVVVFRFSLQFQYNGTLDGKGRYLTAINVTPDYIDVMWGLTFNASSLLVSISNRGTLEYPIAAATVGIAYDTSTVLQDTRAKVNFHLTSKGEITQL